MFKLLIASLFASVVNSSSSPTTVPTVPGAQPLTGLGNTIDYKGKCDPAYAYSCTPYNFSQGACISWYGVCGTDANHCSTTSLYALACETFLNQTLPVTTTTPIPTTTVSTTIAAATQTTQPAVEKAQTSASNQIIVGTAVVLSVIVALFI